WTGQLAQEKTAMTWVSSSRLLYENDEPEKALGLLETAPYFICEHPQIVASRQMITRALQEPYRVVPVGDEPRGRFLVRSLREQEEQIASRPAELPESGLLETAPY